jgi:hypothetical protein
VEKSRFVSQLNVDRCESVKKFILAHRTLFAASGTMAVEWRLRGGRRFGPYFRVKYREGCLQRSLYLGRSQEFAEEVRRLLADLKFHRTFRRLESKIRASLRLQKAHLKNNLQARGYNLKGFEIHKSKSKS